VLLHHAVELPARDGDAQDRPGARRRLHRRRQAAELTPLTTLAFVQLLVEAACPPVSSTS
jgi:hypothetical protein